MDILTISIILNQWTCLQSALFWISGHVYNQHYSESVDMFTISIILNLWTCLQSALFWICGHVYNQHYSESVDTFTISIILNLWTRLQSALFWICGHVYNQHYSESVNQWRSYLDPWVDVCKHGGDDHLLFHSLHKHRQLNYTGFTHRSVSSKST